MAVHPIPLLYLPLPLCRYLLDSGVFPSPVNNEGDTPADLAEDESIVDMIRQQIDKLGGCVGGWVGGWEGGRKCGWVGGWEGGRGDVYMYGYLHSVREGK